MIRLAKAAASARFLASALAEKAAACMPTIARMPTENIKMPISASSSMTPFWFCGECVNGSVMGRLSSRRACLWPQ
jgi:hypothetical protein